MRGRGRGALAEVSGAAAMPGMVGAGVRWRAARPAARVLFFRPWALSAKFASRNSSPRVRSVLELQWS